METLTNFEELISEFYKQKQAEERANHNSSGQLNPSALGQPIQWQVLKIIGVPQQEIDAYTLRVFDRGNDVEKKVVEWLKERGLIEAQKEINHNGVFGYCDALVDGKCFGVEEMPIEIKSVKNSKFKRIQTQGEADRSHKLQGATYALALGYKRYGVLYISADDYRTMFFVGDTGEVKDEIVKTINQVKLCLRNGLVPEFEEIEKWHSNPEYNNYCGFMGLTASEIEDKLKVEYPEQYKKLKQMKEELWLK